MRQKKVKELRRRFKASLTRCCVEEGVSMDFMFMLYRTQWREFKRVCGKGKSIGL